MRLRIFAQPGSGRAAFLVRIVCLSYWRILVDPLLQGCVPLSGLFPQLRSLLRFQVVCNLQYRWARNIFSKGTFPYIYIYIYKPFNTVQKGAEGVLEFGLANRSLSGLETSPDFPFELPPPFLPEAVGGESGSWQTRPLSLQAPRVWGIRSFSGNHSPLLLTFANTTSEKFTVGKSLLDQQGNIQEHLEQMEVTNDEAVQQSKVGCQRKREHAANTDLRCQDNT